MSTFFNREGHKVLRLAQVCRVARRFYRVRRHMAFQESSGSLDQDNYYHPSHFQGTARVCDHPQNHVNAISGTDLVGVREWPASNGRLLWQPQHWGPGPRWSHRCAARHDFAYDLLTRIPAVWSMPGGFTSSASGYQNVDEPTPPQNVSRPPAPAPAPAPTQPQQQSGTYQSV